MSREQIEEMAKVICFDYGRCYKCAISNPLCETPCTILDDCEALYNAGYRQAEDVAREIFEKVKSTLKAYGATSALFIVEQAEKKYESEGAE